MESWQGDSPNKIDRECVNTFPFAFFTILMLFMDFKPMHIKVTVGYRGAPKKCTKTGKGWRPPSSHQLG